MKTQTFGCTAAVEFESRVIVIGEMGHGVFLPVGNKEKGEYEEEVHGNYKNNRINGEDKDSPQDLADIPYDGRVEWIRKSSGRTTEGKYELWQYLKYTEGRGDRVWMEARDRNYVFRLEREGRLDAVEPNLRTEVPKLYQEVISMREQRIAQCSDHLKSHWFRKAYHLQEAERLLKSHVNPDSVLLQLATNSNEDSAIQRLFQITQNIQLSVSREAILEAIEKAENKKHPTVVEFLQRHLQGFQLAQAEQQVEGEEKYQAQLDDSDIFIRGDSVQCQLAKDSAAFRPK